MWGRGRYNAVGGLYDLVSLEPLLYRRPRRDLLHQLDLQPGDTVLDLGCGNGLNFPDVSALVGPCGRIVGVDASMSMLAAAQRRTQNAGWRNVSLISGDLLTLAEVLHRAQIDTAQVDAIIATFALSVRTHGRGVGGDRSTQRCPPCADRYRRHRGTPPAP
jgi:ubiquinone/menaquinone biosynthesis C-methylase UbiE